MIKQKQTPNLSDILYFHKRDIMKSINCVNVGSVQSFDETDQTATIQISVKQVTDVDESGVKTLQEYPVLLKCPVITLTGGSSYLSMPIAQGDTCLIFFNDRDIDNWFYEGGVKSPNTPRVHDLSDGIAIVGIRNIQNAISDYLTNGVRIKYDDACKIDLQENLINSLSLLWFHLGNMVITGALQIGGTVSAYTDGGGADEINIDTKINIVNGNDINVNGDVNSDGDVSDSNTTTPSMQDMRDLFNSHTHGGGSTPDQSMG